VQPVVVLWGDEDANCPVEIARQLLAHQAEYSRFQVHILKGLDHSFRRQIPGLNFLEQMKRPIDESYWNALSDSLPFLMKPAWI
jgi:pimeloyl-ACP methyl ester carboxylesterase